MRTDLIVTATNILASVKLSKLTAPDKAAVIKAYKVLRKEAEEYEELRKIAVEKCKPEGFDDLHAKKEAGKLAGSEVNTYMSMAHDFNAALGLTLKPEGEKEREPDYEAVSADAMTALIDSNPDLSIAEIDLLDTVLTRK